MLLHEYTEKVFDLSIAVDRLTAVVDLLDGYYFESELGDDQISIAWWHSSHDNIQNVFGAIFASVHDIKKGLDLLSTADIKDEEVHALPRSK